MTTMSVAGSESTADAPAGGLPRALLVALSLGAACIHLAMVPAHAGEWKAEGIAFALAAWLQIGVAVAAIVRPRRWVCWVAIVSNLVFIVAWAWTRIDGPPWGPEAGEVHAVGFVDLTCVVLEGLAVQVGIAALLGRRLDGRISRAMAAPVAVVSLAVVGLVSGAIVSPSASNHAHAEGAGHDHGASDDGHAHTDDAVEAEPHSHDEEEATSTAAAMTETEMAAMDEESGHSHGAPVDLANFDDKGLAALSNGEMAHEYGPDESLDATTRAALVHQLSMTRLLAEAFPTLKDAKAAGSEPAGWFGPGMGIHMTTPRSGLPTAPPRDPSVPYVEGTLTDEELMRPANLLYDGTADDSKIAGFMYYSFTPDEPVGFAGPNDHWHTHGSLCIKMGGAGGKIEVLHPAENTGPSCQGIGGFWVEKTNWMVHVWTVPGYESNRGVFSDINPAIACPDGTYYTVSGADNDRYKMNKCTSNPE